LKIEEPKTKVLFGTIKNVLGLSKDSKKLDVLMVAESNQNLNRAVRNLVKTKVSNPQSLNVYDLMNHKHIFIEKDAVPTINRHFKLTKKND
jgi:ribosomal protein L4